MCLQDLSIKRPQNVFMRLQIIDVLKTSSTDLWNIGSYNFTHSVQYWICLEHDFKYAALQRTSWRLVRVPTGLWPMQYIDDIYHHMLSGWFSWSWYLIRVSYGHVVISSGWTTRHLVISIFHNTRWPFSASVERCVNLSILTDCMAIRNLLWLLLFYHVGETRHDKIWNLKINVTLKVKVSDPIRIFSSPNLVI